MLSGANRTLTNNARVVAEGQANLSAQAQAEATIVLSESVFAEARGLITGRVYIDVNRNDRYDEDTDTPLPGARVLLTNGWQTVSDVQGNYAFRDVAADTVAATWTVQLDKESAPYRLRPHPQSFGDGYSRRVRVANVSVLDFALESPSGFTTASREAVLVYGPLTITKQLLPLPDGCARRHRRDHR